MPSHSVCIAIIVVLEMMSCALSIKQQVVTSINCMQLMQFAQMRNVYCFLYKTTEHYHASFVILPCHCHHGRRFALLEKTWSVLMIGAVAVERGHIQMKNLLVLPRSKAIMIMILRFTFTSVCPSIDTEFVGFLTWTTRRHHNVHRGSSPDDNTKPKTAIAITGDVCFRHHFYCSTTTS